MEDMEKTISIPTVSKRSRLLVDAGVVTRKKQGRVYTQNDGENLNRFLDFLDQDEDYGTRVTGNAEEDQQRTDAWNLIEEHGAVRTDKDHRLPVAAFKMLMKYANNGELDVVFVKPGLTLGVKYDGTTHRITAGK